MIRFTLHYKKNPTVDIEGTLLKIQRLYVTTNCQYHTQWGKASGWNETRMTTFTTLIQYCTGMFSKSTQEGEKNRGTQNWINGSQNIHVCK